MSRLRYCRHAISVMAFFPLRIGCSTPQQTVTIRHMTVVSLYSCYFFGVKINVDEFSHNHALHWLYHPKRNDCYDALVPLLQKHATYCVSTNSAYLFDVPSNVNSSRSICALNCALGNALLLINKKNFGIYADIFYVH